jgi:hypothetical protein
VGSLEDALVIFSEGNMKQTAHKAVGQILVVGLVHVRWKIGPATRFQN